MGIRKKIKYENKKMTEKQEKKIAQSMKKYSKNQFKLYLDETGWEDWMDQFVSDGNPTESEIKKIEKIQKDIWSEVFEK
jgi:hypothetical protein